MTNSLADLLAIRLDALSGPTATSRCLIFPEGTFRHPVYGLLKFDADFLGTIKRNFDNKVRVIDPFIDFKHENGESGGWIKELQYVPGTGLYATIAWTPPGYDAVKNQIFRYFSPEYGTHVDEVTGEKHPNTLFAVALTNIPYLKRLPPVQLDESGAAAEAEEIDLTDAVDETDILRYFADRYKDVPDEDFAGPHRSFPIRNINDVSDAWDLRGHADDPDAVARAIIRIARRKGIALPEKIQTWLGDRQSHEEDTDDETELADYPKYPSQRRPQPRPNQGPQSAKRTEDPAAGDDEDEEDDPSEEDEEELADGDPNAQPKPRKKKRVNRPHGNEGAQQPSRPKGARPHINRGRQPDPQGEMASMSDTENREGAQETVSLDEYRALIERLNTEKTELHERMAEMRRSLMERDVTDECRRLSERSVVVTDGDNERTATFKFGIPPVVLAQYRAFATEHPELRTAVLDMLMAVRETGLVKLAEDGSSRQREEHDPDAAGVSLDEKILRRAEELATADGKAFNDLATADKLVYSVRAERELAR